jgi:hypothetical protein
MRLSSLTKHFFLAAVTCGALVIGAREAAALEFQRVPLQSPAVAIFARGIIMPGDADGLSAFIAGLPQSDRATSLLVNSPGGNVLEAQKLADVIAKDKLSVFVPPSSQCSSACFPLFAAGAGRFAAPGAVIGLDTPHLPNGEETETSLALTTIMARDLAQDGVPDAILGKLVRTLPGHATYLTASDFHAMGVRFIDDPRWR